MRRGDSGPLTGPPQVAASERGGSEIPTYRRANETDNSHSASDTSQVQPQSNEVALCAAPLLPATYVERSEIIGLVVRDIVAASSQSLGGLSATVIHGLGGIGKSTLAKAICRNNRIQSTFSDGVLWAEVGQQPNIEHLAARWLRLLDGNDHLQNTFSETVDALRATLQDRKVLLVLDNVWDPSDIDALLVAEAPTHFLVTTRRVAVADHLGAKSRTLDVMSSTEAKRLIEAWIRKPLGGPTLEQALEFADAVGFLPLAVQLGAAMASRGRKWEEITRAFKAEIVDIAPTDYQSRQLRTVRACLNISLNQLRNEDEHAWKCFVRLGTTARGTQITPLLASRIWHTDDHTANNILSSLADDALIQVEDDSFRLHDLMHDLAQMLLYREPPIGLDETPEKAHFAIIKSYLPNQKLTEVFQVRPDGYFHENLTWHMEMSGLTAEIHRLLQQSSRDGQNAWYATLSLHGLTYRFEPDVARARRLASSEDASFPLLCRYALITGSLRGLEQRMTAGLVFALLKREMISYPQAFSWATRLRDLRESGLLLTCLLEEMPATDANQGLRSVAIASALRCVQEMANFHVRGSLAARLAKECTGEERKAAFEIAVGDARKYATNALEILNLLPNELQDSALSTVLGLTEFPYKVAEDFARKLGECDRHLRKIRSGALLSWCSRRLSNLSRKSLLRPNGNQERSNATDERAKLRYVLDLLVEQVDVEHAEALEQELRLFGDSELNDKLRYVRSKGDTFAARSFQKLERLNCEERSKFILRHFSELSPDERTRAIAFLETDLQHLQDPVEALHAATDAIPRLKIESLARKLSTTELNNSGADNGRRLARLAALLPADERIPLVAEANRRFSQSSLESNALIAILSVCRKSEITRLLKNLRIGDEKQQNALRFHLAAALNDPTLLEGISALDNSEQQLRTLTRLMGQLSTALDQHTLRDFINAASRVTSEWWTVEALWMVALRLDRASKLLELFKAAEHISIVDLRTRLKGRVIFRLALLDNIPLAIEKCAELDLEIERHRIMADLATKLGARGSLDGALTVAAAISDQFERSHAYAMVTLYIAQAGDVDRARVLTNEIHVEQWRTWARSMLRSASKSAKRNIFEKKRRDAPNQDSDFNDWILETLRERNHTAQDGRRVWNRIMEVAETRSNGKGNRALRDLWLDPNGASVLEILVEHGRGEFMIDLRHLVPMLSRWGAPGDVRALADSLSDVSAWWP